MNQPNELLPDELLWADGGHASDVVLTALADGQLDIVPANVRSHVEGCRACTTHLGNAALLSLHAQRELQIVKEADAASARRPLPRLAIVLGLVVAMIGLLPSLPEAPADAETARTFATHTAPILVRALGTLGQKLMDPSQPFGLVLTYGTASVLVLMTLLAVRYLPQKKEVSR
jgi:hypothetical protein